MNKFTDINKIYWENIPAESIIGRNAFPGEELFEKLDKGSDILDLGCGTGEMSEFLSEHGFNVNGIDINAEAIRWNKSRGTKVTYIQCNAQKRLPFDNNSFAAVVSSFVLVNILPLAARQNLISELKRILKPKGFMWVNEALVSESYKMRYELAKPYLQENYNFFVFKEGLFSSAVQTPEQLKKAIADNKIARISHHFSTQELHELFEGFSTVYKKESLTVSPNTKMEIKMIISVFQYKP